ncbi:MAG TPA: DUF1206 domain-containing protein [Candidatus Eisenbacteria bacterium]|nr:DUF1206 domain-containing protein [Candidatus Eisenbacteria bacterium]
MAYSPAQGRDLQLGRNHGASGFRRARDRWLEGLMRFGQLARAFVFLIPAAFALRIAVSSKGDAIDQKEAIETLGNQPLGNVLVVIVAVGLAGYALWGLYRALLDPLKRGWSLAGVFTRLGYLTSGLAYGALLWFAVQIMLGTPHDERSTQEWTAGALARPFGSWIVIVIGLAWIAFAGLVQLWMALRASFMRDLDLSRMGPGEHVWARHLGRIGIASRAIVFILIGISLVMAGLRIDPEESRDLGGAFLKLLNEPFGRPALIAVASGLIAFGVYSILCVRWARVRPDEPPSAVPLPMTRYSMR